MVYDFCARQQLYRTATEALLDNALKIPNTRYAVLMQAMRYSALSGGKRLRAMLTLDFCRMACGDYRYAVPFAAAIEMVHAYSLIHDDLPCMDDDDLRRGKPACHIRYGQANALLAGDALLTRAFSLILTDGVKIAGMQAATRCAAMLAECAGSDGMIGGQVIDLLYEHSPDTNEDTLIDLHTRKTGALFKAACCMGALAGGMDESLFCHCERYAAEFGLAFQIIDDVLDVTATAQQLGKNIGSDKENGKTTYATLYGADDARALAARHIQSAKKAIECIGSQDTFLLDLANLVISRTN